MSVDFTVNAEPRTDAGKGASRRLRHTGKVPGIIYGAGKDAMSLAMSHDEMQHHLEHEAFYSHVLTVSIGGKNEKAVLKDVQRHPSKPKIMHVDFLRISATHKIQMHIPLHFTGESTSPGVKEGGLISHLLAGVDVVCLAKNLPEFLEVDASAMELSTSLHLSDIKLPEGVEIPALAQGDDHDLPIVSLNKPKKEIVEEDIAPVADASAEDEGDKTE